MPLKTINYLQSQGTFTFFHPRGNYEEKEDEKVVLSTVFVIIKMFLFLLLAFQQTLSFFVIFLFLQVKNINFAPWKCFP